MPVLSYEIAQLNTWVKENQKTCEYCTRGKKLDSIELKVWKESATKHLI